MADTKKEGGKDGPSAAAEKETKTSECGCGCGCIPPFKK